MLGKTTLYGNSFDNEDSSSSRSSLGAWPGRSATWESRLVLIDRRNWAAHSPWILFTIAATIGASIWYFAASAAGSDWPGGSSPPGFTFGVLGGLICIFELL